MTAPELYELLIDGFFLSINASKISVDAVTLQKFPVRIILSSNKL